MIEDMTIRKFPPKTQGDYLSHDKVVRWLDEKLSIGRT
jgi:hypothetical protein